MSEVHLPEVAPHPQGMDDGDILVRLSRSPPCSADRMCEKVTR